MQMCQTSPRCSNLSFTAGVLDQDKVQRILLVPRAYALVISAPIASVGSGKIKHHLGRGNGVQGVTLVFKGSLLTNGSFCYTSALNRMVLRRGYDELYQLSCVKCLMRRSRNTRFFYRTFIKKGRLGLLRPIKEMLGQVLLTGTYGRAGACS